MCVPAGAERTKDATPFQRSMATERVGAIAAGILSRQAEYTVQLRVYCGQARESEAEGCACFEVAIVVVMWGAAQVLGDFWE